MKFLLQVPPLPLKPISCYYNTDLMATQWDEKRSRWYCRAVEHSNYPRRAVAVLTPLLKKCDSVVDFGAGCGALSIPISGKLKKVTAIEPSIWMYKLLLKRLKKAGLKNIKAYNTGWKSHRLQGELHTKLESHDMVICANLPENVVCNVNFLRYITQISTKFIVYIQNAGEWNKFYYKDLYPMLFKKKYVYKSNYIKTCKFLHQHGISANIKIFNYYHDQPFEDFNDAMDFWQHRLKIKLTSRKGKILADFLKKKLIATRKRFSESRYESTPMGRADRSVGTTGRNNTLIAPFGLRKAVLIWWES